MPRKPSDTVQLKLRFPERLRVRIENAASKSGHSMNSEIVRRLEQSFSRDDVSGIIEASATATAHAMVHHFVTGQSHTFVMGDQGTHTAPHTGATVSAAGSHTLPPPMQAVTGSKSEGAARRKSRPRGKKP